jgi:addiction module RelE/StbE family toxin
MKSYKVVWTESAKFDLESIIEYIKTDSISSAKKIFFEIKEKCDELSFSPKKFRIVPELQQIGILKYREAIYKRWRIVYKIENKIVYILIVIDSSRNIEDLLFQRLVR